MMEIRWLRAASAVAEHLHFGRAAVSLDIAQSQVSQQVAALERDLGVRLFDRDSRNVAPTSAGAAFLADARAALERLDAAAERARAAGRGEHGTLAIGTVGSALSAPLPRLLRAFRERFPAVTVAFAELTTAEQVERLRTGTLDVGFLRPPLPDPGARELELITVAREELVAVLPPGHRLAGRSAVRLSALRDDPFVRNPRRLGAGLHETVTARCRAVGFEPRVAQEAVDMDTVVGLVAAGYGVAVVPASVAGREPRDVTFARLVPAGPPIELALAVPDRPPSPVAERFVALARDLGPVRL
jgi:DNA-binding transcriptional LysR family regulator